MPEIKSEVNPPKGSDFVSIATFLPVRRWLDVIPFFRISTKVSEQLKKSEVIRFGLKNILPHKRFWTISIWADRESMRRFVAAEPHATATRKFTRWGGQGAAFAEWNNNDGSLDWAEAKERLKTPTRYYKV